MEDYQALINLHQAIERLLRDDTTMELDNFLEQLEGLLFDRQALIEQYDHRYGQGKWPGDYPGEAIADVSVRLQELLTEKMNQVQRKIEEIKDEKKRLVSTKKANRTYGYIAPTTEGFFIDKKR